VNLAPAEVSVEVALTAVDDDASAGNSLTVSDSNCVAPTAEVPNCGELRLPNGANGHVILSVGACDGLVASCRIVENTKALVVTAIADLDINDPDGIRFTPKRHLPPSSLRATRISVGRLRMAYLKSRSSSPRRTSDRSTTRPRRARPRA
jgi:hypothetical protein